MFYTEPKVTVLARPAFAEPSHLPVHWIGPSTDGERLAEFAGRLCYMSQKNPAGRDTREYLENIKRQRHGSVLEHASYSLLIEGVSRALSHELVRHRTAFLFPTLPAVRGRVGSQLRGSAGDPGRRGARDGMARARWNGRRPRTSRSSRS